MSFVFKSLLFSNDITKKEVTVFNNPDLSKNLIIQLGDKSELNLVEKEINYLSTIPNIPSFSIFFILIDKWFEELTPWSNPPVFGNQSFGDKASITYDFIQDLINKLINSIYPRKNKYLCGYSLAGLFSLWYGYQSNSFNGIASCSPSVWYPKWDEFILKNTMKTNNIYLSLGKKEDQTKNKIIKQISSKIKTQYSLLIKENINSVLEWNEGNHFSNPEIRLARGISWLLKQN